MRQAPFHLPPGARQARSPRLIDTKGPAFLAARLFNVIPAPAAPGSSACPLCALPVSSDAIRPGPAFSLVRAGSGEFALTPIPILDLPDPVSVQAI